MMRATKLCFAALIVTAILSHAQMASPQRPTQKDSVDVSANISKKQLALEKQLKEALNRAETDRSQHDFAAALKGFQNALETVRSEPLLKEQEDSVLVKVGRAHIEANQPEEAVRSYTALLQLRKNDCKPAAPEMERCAEAQTNLGFAQMNAGDFSTALPVLREAVASYGTAASSGHSEEYRLIKLKEQAETQTLLAMALFRTGQQSNAIKIIESAISQLKTVQSNQNIEISIRNSAQKSLQTAEQISASMKGN